MKLPWFVLGLSAAVVTAKSSILNSDWNVLQLQRTIDLSAGAISRVSSVITLDASSNGADVFKIAIPEHVHDTLSSIEAFAGKATTAASQLVLAKAFHDLSKNAIIYNVVLPERQGENVTLTLQEVYTYPATPLPAQLPQTSQDGQALLWAGDLLGGLSLLHPVAEAKIRVKVPSPLVKATKAPQGFKVTHSAGSAIVVFVSSGPISASKALHVGSVHYAQPTPVVGFRNLDRTIQVSHWASSISFEDSIELVNKGPTLKGHFARIEHQRQSWAQKGISSASHVLSRLSMPLPPRVHSPYYYDTVGNVSWSNFRPSHDPRLPKSRGKKESLLELRPRYPLLGGWTYNFTVGYVSPAEQYLKKQGTTHILAVPFVNAVKDIPIDRATVSIRLPEGAKITNVQTPFPVDAMDQVVTFTFLDTTGHPTIEFVKTSVSDVHNKPILITYEYTTYALLQKPVVAATAGLVVFLSALVFKRLEWSIATPKKTV